MTTTDIVVDETDIVVDKKDENIQDDSNSKPRPPKFISFSLLMGQVILSDLQMHL